MPPLLAITRMKRARSPAAAMRKKMNGGNLAFLIATSISKTS